METSHAGDHAKRGIQSMNREHDAELDRAARTSGFLYIQGHGLAPELIRGVEAAAASFFALGNLLGLSLLSADLSEAAREIELEDASLFPDRGYVKVGRELIKYEKKEGNRLTGCERSLLASKAEHGPAEKHVVGDWAVNFAAWAMRGTIRHICRGVQCDRGQLKRFARSLTKHNVTHLLPSLSLYAPFCHGAKQFMPGSAANLFARELVLNQPTSSNAPSLSLSGEDAPVSG